MFFAEGINTYESVFSRKNKTAVSSYSKTSGSLLLTCLRATAHDFFEQKEHQLGLNSTHETTGVKLQKEKQISRSQAGA